VDALSRRFLLFGAIVGAAVWSAAFSVYGAYRERADEVRQVARAEVFAGTLAGVLDAAAADGPESLTRIVAGMTAGQVVRAAAVLGPAGEVLLASPGLHLGAEPLAAAECRGCHTPGQPRARDTAVRSQGVVHWFGPGAVGGRHLYLALAAPPLGAAGGELWLVFATGVVAVGALSLVWWWGLGAWVLRPAEGLLQELGVSSTAVRGFPEGFAEWVGAAAGAVAEQRAVHETLRRRCGAWEAAGETAQQQLASAEQAASSSRESGRRLLLAAEQLDRTMTTFGDHLNGISTSASDNATSLVEMSSSVDEVAGSVEQLSRFVGSTAASVEQMVEAIGEVAERVETLGTETDVTALSMSHIDTSTREIEVNAREATTLSGRMAEAARDGSRAVQETLQGIHASYEVIQGTARAMDELQESSLAIWGVVKIINEINDKTKLLALNAAIIAAQAGEHGKSFAVVAHEIKSLSDRTANSTGEISRLIKAIRQSMAAAAEAVARGEGATGSSVVLAERAGEALRHIRDTAQVAHDMTHGILVATEEQSRGSQKVMAAMQEVNAMVAYIRQAAWEHRTSGEAVTAETAAMRELTEQVKIATGEQAEVSHYLSDAIAVIDSNLHAMVAAANGKRAETRQLVSQAGELEQQGEIQQRTIHAAQNFLRTASRESAEGREAG